MLIRFYFLNIILIQTCFAAWSSESLSIMNSKKKYVEYTKPAFITYWGGVKRYFLGRDLEGIEFKYKDPLLTKPFNVYYKKSSKKKAPLIIFFPGIHGNYSGQISPSIINWFEQVDHHVFSLPNFLHVDYIKAGPKYDLSNTATLDAQVALNAISAGVDKIGKENISHISFVGESLGAFLAASTVNVFESFKYKSMIKNVILLWPPLIMNKTLKRFDRFINATKETHSECSMVMNFYRKLRFYVFQEKPHSFSIEDEVCLDAEMFHGAFLKSINKAYSAHAKRVKIKKDKPQNFTEFFKLYNPNFIKVINDENQNINLKYLLSLWKKEDVNLKVVSSTDDFINEPSDWDDIESKYLYEWGSHCAPLSLDDWGMILSKEVL